MTLVKSQAREGDRAAERLERGRWRGISGATHDGKANAWTDICEHLTLALRGWPIREIQRRVGLSEPQRVALYELVSLSLKVAETLAGACPAETALTPPARMALLRARLAAVRQATVAIRPALTQFYEALDQGAEGPVCRAALMLRLGSPTLLKPHRVFPRSRSPDGDCSLQHSAESDFVRNGPEAETKTS